MMASGTLWLKKFFVLRNIEKEKGVYVIYYIVSVLSF